MELRLRIYRLPYSVWQSAYPTELCALLDISYIVSWPRQYLDTQVDIWGNTPLASISRVWDRYGSQHYSVSDQYQLILNQCRIEIVDLDTKSGAISDDINLRWIRDWFHPLKEHTVCHIMEIIQIDSWLTELSAGKWFCQQEWNTLWLHEVWLVCSLVCFIKLKCSHTALYNPT